MNRKQFSTHLIIAGVVFVSLVFYNYFQAQKNLSTRPSEFDVTLQNTPLESRVGDQVSFRWLVNSTGSFSTISTAIYWSENSSPSALTQNDSPQAVGYPYQTPDYLNGVFTLPDSFDANIVFQSADTIYYRAYAKINGQHYWSDEKKLIIAN